MSDVYDIWLYPLQDWWKTVSEMSDFMSTGQMGNFIFRHILIYLIPYMVKMFQVFGMRDHVHTAWVLS